MSIAGNLSDIRSRIEQAALRVQRDPEEIHLIAVTKTHAAASVNEALRAGITMIGENKVQEAEGKLAELMLPFEFHFIGHLQTNKIGKLLALRPVLIHSIDSLHLAEKLHEQMRKLDRIQDILIEVKTTDEESKSGIPEAEAVALIESVSRLERIRIRGLMTIGKLAEDPEASRTYFRQLKLLFDRVAAMRLEGVDMCYLSMGMSDDFEVAIEEGSNMVRIGSALFGNRVYV